MVAAGLRCREGRRAASRGTEISALDLQHSARHIAHAPAHRWMQSVPSEGEGVVILEVPGVPPESASLGLSSYNNA